jgi:uncharacterized membrane protein
MPSSQEYIDQPPGLYVRMTLTGRLHPLLVHFPIALVLVAAVAELVFVTTRFPQWHTVAVANVRAGAAFGVASAGAGWLLASSRLVEASPALEWHRWLGLAAAVAAIAAALATSEMDRSPRRLWLYRVALFWAAALVAVAGHFGAVLVWGANFLRP